MQEQVLTQFLLENQAYLYRMAYSYLKNQEDAMDAVQSTACRALERCRTLRDPSAVRPWVTRILLNICKNALRLRKKLLYLPDEQLDLGGYTMPEPEDSLTRQIEALLMKIRTHHKVDYIALDIIVSPLLPRQRLQYVFPAVSVRSAVQVCPT